MKSRALFNGIQAHLAKFIDGCEQSIDIAVAWFTSEELFGCLNEAYNRGVSIRLLISDDNLNKKLSFHGINRESGEVRMITSNKFLHEKFALFDNKDLIHGSYNWTYSAEFRNYESIISTDDELLLKQFRIRFNNLFKEGELYSRNNLLGRSSTGFEKIEKHLQGLEEELNTELKEAIEFVVKKKVPINRNIIEEILKRYGAIGACRRLAKDSMIQAGLQKVWESGLIDYSIEAIMTKEKYKPLFSEEDIKNAQQKIQILKR